MFVRVIVYICFRRCWVSLGHIVSLLSVFPFLLSLMHALKSARLTSAHLGSPQAGILPYFSFSPGFVSFFLPVRFLAERLTKGCDC